VGGREKKKRDRERKAANVLSPQIYCVVSDVHMPKTLAHLELMEATHSTHTHTHPCNTTATLPEGGRGGSMSGSHFKLVKRGAGPITADGLYLGP